MDSDSRKSLEDEITEEQSPFLSQEEILGSRENDLVDTRLPRFSLEGTEYPEANIPLDSHPLLDELILLQPDFFRQEMGSALGVQSGHRSWLHSANREGRSLLENNDDMLLDNTRKLYLDTRWSPRNSELHRDRDLTFEIPMITLNTSNLEPPQADSGAHNISDLETGLYMPPVTPSPRDLSSNALSLPPGSPSKLSGFITKLTDRIAGPTHLPTPTADTNVSSSWENELIEQASRRSSLMVASSSSVNARPSLALNTSLPFVLSLGLSSHSSKESIHSLDIQGGPGTRMLTPEPSRLSHMASLGSSAIVSNASSHVSEHLPPTSFYHQEEEHPSSSEYPSLRCRSLGIFSDTSPFRKWCHRIISHKYTNLIVTLIIVLQTSLLAYRQWDPKQEQGNYFHGYAPIDYVLIIINLLYTIEIVLKIVSYGLYDDKIMIQNLGMGCLEGMLIFANSAVYSFLRDTLLTLASHMRRSKAHSKADTTTTSSSSASLTSKALAINIEGRSNYLNTTILNSINSSDAVSSYAGNEGSNLNTLLRLSYLGTLLDDLRIKRAVLRDNWQRLDLIAVISFWISFALSFNHCDARHHIMIFRALSCLRILRLCRLTDGTNIILRTCESCMPQLIDVGVFIACFWFIIGIIGVQSFKSSLSRHCVWTNPNNSSEVLINSDLYCGSYLGLDGNAYTHLDRQGNHVGYVKGFRCPMYSVCQSGENPYGGTVNFDNIFQSMQMVFVLMSVNTFTDTMYNLMDSDSLASSLFYIVGVFILTVWLLNIFTAVIVASFKSIQLETAEEEKRVAERLGKVGFLKSIFNNDVHSIKVRELIQKKPLLRTYYRFEFLFILVIIASLVTQAFRDSDMPDSRVHTLYRAESSFTLILLLEIILRFMLYVPQIKTFFLSRRNCFDLGLAIITSIIILGPVKEKLGHAYYWLTFFQCVRFYRVALSSSITSDLWVKIFRNLKPFYDLTLFYFILLVLSGIIFARYFEGTVPPDDLDNVDFAMHTLPNTLMSLYVITTTENWADIMFELQKYAGNTFQRTLGSMLIIFWFIFTNLIIMNVFIAVIAASLELSIEGRREYQVQHFIEDMTERLYTVRVNPGWIHKLKNKAFNSKEEKNMEKVITNLLLSGRAVNEFLSGEDIEMETRESKMNAGASKNGLFRWWHAKRQSIKTLFQNPFYSRRSARTDVRDFDPTAFATKVITERRKLITEQDEYLKSNPNFNFVFYVLGPRHKVRRYCQRIVPSSYGQRIDGVEPNKTVSDIFSLFMFLSTVAIVLSACLQTPLYRSEVGAKVGRYNWTFYIDAGFMVIFSLEFLLRTFADGLLFTPNAYIRSPWNWLDFGALVSLWIEFIAFLRSDSDLSRVVRGLKALRALRILTISETAKNNFQYTMISGFGKILSAGIISLTLLLPFSVWGLNIFSGRLGYCLDGSSNDADCFNEYQNKVFDWEIVSPNVYVQPHLYMDNFKVSFSSLYQIVSLEGWVDLLLDVMKGTGSGIPRQPFATPMNGLWVILFNFISTIFILTLFVSVIISNYSKVTGRAYLTPVQVQWYHVKKYLLQVKPSKREEITLLKGFRKFCYTVTVEKNKAWNFVLSLALIMHVFVLLFEAFPTVVAGRIRHVCFVIASSCFLVNYIMLSVAKSFKVFVQNKWNIFSLLVAFGAWCTTILAFAIDADSIFINFNKLFLVGLLIFLFPRSDRLNQLLKFASASFPSLFSLLFTWFVMFLMYAIAMNQIFGMTKVGPNTTGNINLRSVSKAMILLFRCSFGEGWNYIMDDFTLEVPFCIAASSNGDSDCGNKQYAYVLFMSWNLISMYIMVNLFVSLILDSFSYIAGGKQYSHLISRSEIRKFKRSWQKFDPEGTGFISSPDLPKLLRLLEGSLSFNFYSDILSIQDLCSRWITRNSLSNPYDIEIDCDEMNAILLKMDTTKLHEQRKVYERFLEKAHMNMELHEECGICFSKFLVQVPLYNSFNQSECLIFIDFMEADLLEKKVAEKLKKKRCYELIKGYACRWKYLKHKRGEILKEEFSYRESHPPSPSVYGQGL